jgi:hypothetical protein
MNTSENMKKHFFSPSKDHGPDVEEPGLFEEVSELGPKDAGEGFFRQEVVVFCRAPSVAVRSQPAPGDQIVHMGVVAKVSSPALQDSDHAEGASDVFGIGSELLQGLLEGMEEQVVEELLIAPDQATQVSGQSEGGHEVWDGQEQGSLLLDPAVDLVVLTLRAMAVLAGVIPIVVLLALGAAVEMTAQGLGAAGADVLYNPPVAGKQPVVVFGDIVRAMQAEDVRQLRHD